MTGAPFLIGLTGSIGMGKSTTAAMFAECGAAVWDADAAVHRLYAAGGAAVEPIAQIHPAAIVGGAVDRSALKAWIAEDPAALPLLEARVHPLVARDRAAFIARQTQEGAEIVVCDIPLLFETAGEGQFDMIVVVSAPAETQRERVLARPGMTRDHFEAILAKQISDAEKRRRADVVVPTETLEGARRAVQETVQRIRRQRANA
ncbi:dephospho-CoA kinase [Brevirhabdus sp.]|uniref:dephospho-CoA kinase n=1 Tax=Brevirhabdus sp. TaxID=2004514 RepID=UPI0040590C51